MLKGILERLAEGPVLGDGGYMQELGRRGVVVEGPYTPEICLKYPHAIKEMHWEFLHAGAEVIQALAFYGSRSHLEAVGLGDRVRQVNRAAVKLAKEVAEDKNLLEGIEPPLVAGNLSTTWRYIPGDEDSYENVRQDFREQLEEQVAEGVDFIISEFIFHLGEALLSLEEAKKTGLPVMVTMSFEDREMKSKDGYTPAQCAKRLADAGADIVGTNCSRGPKDILPVVRQMTKAVNVPVAVQPAALRTTRKYPAFFQFPGFPEALEPHIATRYDMAESAKTAYDLGARYIGGCCATNAGHLREMGRAIGKIVPQPLGFGLDYGRPTSMTERYKRTPGQRK